MIRRLPAGSSWEAVSAGRPAGLLPGSFNPLHDGHRELRLAAERRLGGAVHFELSRANAEKPPLSDEEVARRGRQFAGVAPLWVTDAPLFCDKARLFPGAAFVLGHDTAVRLIDPRYADGTAAGRDAVLRLLAECGCRLLVGGRLDAGGRFCEWATPTGLPAGLFEAIPAAEFRADVSSTELRARRRG